MTNWLRQEKQQTQKTTLHIFHSFYIDLCFLTSDPDDEIFGKASNCTFVNGQKMLHIHKKIEVCGLCLHGYSFQPKSKGTVYILFSPILWEKSPIEHNGVYFRVAVYKTATHQFPHRTCIILLLGFPFPFLVFPYF